MKTKKPYIKPTMVIVDADIKTSLLAGSSDNPYWEGEWEEPEVKPGCQNAWHC